MIKVLFFIHCLLFGSLVASDASNWREDQDWVYKGKRSRENIYRNFEAKKSRYHKRRRKNAKSVCYGQKPPKLRSTKKRSGKIAKETERPAKKINFTEKGEEEINALCDHVKKLELVDEGIVNQDLEEIAIQVAEKVLEDEWDVFLQELHKADFSGTKKLEATLKQMPPVSTKGCWGFKPGEDGDLKSVKTKELPRSAFPMFPSILDQYFSANTVYSDELRYRSCWRMSEEEIKKYLNTEQTKRFLII